MRRAPRGRQRRARGSGEGDGGSWGWMSWRVPPDTVRRSSSGELTLRPVARSMEDLVGNVSPNVSIPFHGAVDSAIPGGVRRRTTCSGQRRIEGSMAGPPHGEVSVGESPARVTLETRSKTTHRDRCGGVTLARAPSDPRRMSATTIVVIAKSPVAGRVKTRCCPPCTPGQAADLAAASLADTLDAVRERGHGHVVALDGRPGPWLPVGFDVVARVRRRSRDPHRSCVGRDRGAGAADRDGHAAGDDRGPRPRAGS